MPRYTRDAIGSGWTPGGVYSDHYLKEKVINTSGARGLSGDSITSAVSVESADMVYVTLTTTDAEGNDMELLLLTATDVALYDPDTMTFSDTQTFQYTFAFRKGTAVSIAAPTIADITFTRSGTFTQFAGTRGSDDVVATLSLETSVTNGSFRLSDNTNAGAATITIEDSEGNAVTGWTVNTPTVTNTTWSTTVTLDNADLQEAETYTVTVSGLTAVPTGSATVTNQTVLENQITTVTITPVAAPVFTPTNPIFYVNGGEQDGDIRLTVGTPYVLQVGSDLPTSTRTGFTVNGFFDTLGTNGVYIPMTLSAAGAQSSDDITYTWPTGANGIQYRHQGQVEWQDLPDSAASQSFALQVSGTVSITRSTAPTSFVQYTQTPGNLVVSYVISEGSWTTPGELGGVTGNISGTTLSYTIPVTNAQLQTTGTLDYAFGTRPTYTPTNGQTTTATATQMPDVSIPVSATTRSYGFPSALTISPNTFVENTAQTITVTFPMTGNAADGAIINTGTITTTIPGATVGTPTINGDSVTVDIDLTAANNQNTGTYTVSIAGTQIRTTGQTGTTTLSGSVTSNVVVTPATAATIGFTPSITQYQQYTDLGDITITGAVTGGTFRSGTVSATQTGNSNIAVTLTSGANTASPVWTITGVDYDLNANVVFTTDDFILRNTGATTNNNATDPADVTITAVATAQTPLTATVTASATTFNALQTANAIPTITVTPSEGTISNLQVAGTAFTSGGRIPAGDLTAPTTTSTASTTLAVTGTITSGGRTQSFSQNVTITAFLPRSQFISGVSSSTLGTQTTQESITGSTTLSANQFLVTTYPSIETYTVSVLSNGQSLGDARGTPQSGTQTLFNNSTVNYTTDVMRASNDNYQITYS